MSSTPSVPRWTHHHTVAMCQDPTCNWDREYHGTDQHEANLVVKAAGKHNRRHNHWVEVERGAHRDFDAWPE